MRDLIFKVITSWQVIVVTVALVFYCFLVNAAARLDNKTRVKLPALPKKNRQTLPPAEPPPEKGNDDADELGLEE
ncbi:hypothetical protein LQZ21_13080 [Treponema sp. TIM-1]|uniref:hypothetical protein n=1 Tax=Treponema sp. TIM-1 TaxID=2898417 RepID=UPI0039802889